MALTIAAIAVIAITHRHPEAVEVEIAVLDAATGDRVSEWRFGVDTRPITTADRIIFSTRDKVTAIEVTGEIDWETRLSGVTSLRPENSVLYANGRNRDREPTGAALDAATGELLWKAEDSYIGSGNEHLAMVSSDGDHTIVTARSGNTVAQLRKQPKSVVFDGAVAVAQFGRTVQVISSSSSEQWRFDDARRGRHLLALSDGVLIVRHHGTGSGTVLRGYRTDSGLEIWCGALPG